MTKEHKVKFEEGWLAIRSYVLGHDMAEKGDVEKLIDDLTPSQPEKPEGGERKNFQLSPFKKEKTLLECPTGLFLKDGELCLKTEYRNDNGRVEAYIVSTGEAYWGGLNQGKDPNMDLVIPVMIK
jgi:hypothetical protein